MLPMTSRCPRPLAFARAARRPLRLSLADLLNLHGAASPAVLLLVLALLCALPAAGVGTVLSLAIIALAGRWHACHVRGDDPADGVLPARLAVPLANWRLGEAWSRRCLRMLAWLYAAAGRLLRERWSWACAGRTTRWWGGWIALMGLLILLPIPLGNVLPAISLVLLSLGWMFRDGVTLAASAAVGTGALVFAWSAAGWLLQAGQALAARLG
jgi:hypothetical protein